MIYMILRELLNHFEIGEDLPDYLLSHTFNEIFLDGTLTKEDKNYKIVIKTRQNVTHMMFIRPDDEFPVVIMSKLPNGFFNGMKFPKDEGKGVPINKL